MLNADQGLGNLSLLNCDFGQMVLLLLLLYLEGGAINTTCLISLEKQRICFKQSFQNIFDSAFIILRHNNCRPVN